MTNPRRGHWAFLEELQLQNGCVRRAAELSGTSCTTAYLLRRNNKTFAGLWDLAVRCGLTKEVKRVWLDNWAAHV